MSTRPAVRVGQGWRARLLVALSGVVALAAMATPAEASSPSWWNYTRPASYESIAVETAFTTADGTNLACILRRPGISGKPAPGRFPSLVVQYWPYALVGPYLTAEPEFFTERGYATVTCNVRGTGSSEGTYPGIFQPLETQDNFELIEWMGSQSWSNGQVGQEGQSYGGMTSLRVAALRPSHLKAIAPQFVGDSVYSDVLYPGGIRSSNGMEIAGAIDELSGGRTDPAAQLQLWEEHPLRDAYWDQVDIAPKWPKIDLPTLVQGGWYDYFRKGDVRTFEGLKDAWLVDGPWYHFGGVDWTTDSPPAENLPRGVFLAFFDRWLGGAPSAPNPPTRVRAFELPENGGHGWRQLDDFPPSDVEEVPATLATGGRLARAAGPAGFRSYLVDANDGPAAICSPEPSPEMPSPCDPFQDEQALDANRLTFTSSALRHDVVLAGTPVVHLRAALTATNGAFAVRVSDVSPDGTVREASVGYLRASHRLSDYHEAAIVPGRFYSYSVEIEPLFWRFQTGHRLRISISSGDTPRIDPVAESGEVTIKTGSGGSFVEFPVRR